MVIYCEFNSTLHSAFQEYVFVSWGVAWSSGQHRRLPLQGSRVQTSIVPLLFFEFFFGLRLTPIQSEPLGPLGLIRLTLDVRVR